MWQKIVSQINSMFYILIALILFIFVIQAIFTILRKKRITREDKYANLKFMNKLDILSKAEFKKYSLMNKKEYLLFSKLEHLLDKQQFGKYFRLFSQVAMGEFIQCNDRYAFNLINSKRVDFLIIDRYGQPVIVIEYQGEGHYQDNAIERDAIKKECCRKAEIDYIEFTPNYDELDFQRVVKILNENYLSTKKNKENYAKSNPNQLAKSR
ncbi:DUF2726 domain-containing protein [Pasteurella sp. PK-2025]|uniref:DUF2726 domain-containing protein n=1 Tax=unclassified Pasteurella TaxID=2621516 RepID=UPI003C757E69